MGMFDSIVLDNRQRKLLAELVNAERKAQPERVRFLAFRFTGADPRLSTTHPGLPDGSLISLDDLEILAKPGLVRLSENKKDIMWSFYVMPLGSKYHDEVIAPDMASLATVVALPEPPPTLATAVADMIQAAWQRSDELLAQGHVLEAVQKALWLLETMLTAFQGKGSTGTVEGTYFNDIVKDLRRLNRGTALDQILRWMTALHGYLSEPTGGGVRHGVDVNTGITMSPNEARLYCNLIRSYLTFLLAEHGRLTQGVTV